MNFIAPFSSSAYLVFRNLKDVKNPLGFLTSGAIWFHELRYDLFLHLHLQLQANPKRIGPKNLMLSLVSMGETGFSHEKIASGFLVQFFLG